ncbi:hypothetical protein ACFQ0M_41880 [Kitasatospora aburaviensis]
MLDGWRALAAADPAGSWFTTPEWALSWWETLGAQQGTGEVTVWREADGRVCAVVPLLRTRRRLHPRAPMAVPCLTVLGSGPGAADHCGFSAAPERRAEVADWLRRRGRRATLLLTDLDPEQAGLLPPGAVATGRTLPAHRPHRWPGRARLPAVPRRPAPLRTEAGRRGDHLPLGRPGGRGR